MMRSEIEAVSATASNVDPPPGRWSSHNVDRGVHQVGGIYGEVIASYWNTNALDFFFFSCVI